MDTAYRLRTTELQWQRLNDARDLGLLSARVRSVVWELTSRFFLAAKAAFLAATLGPAAGFFVATFLAGGGESSGWAVRCVAYDMSAWRLCPIVDGAEGGDGGGAGAAGSGAGRQLGPRFDALQMLTQCLQSGERDLVRRLPSANMPWAKAKHRLTCGHSTQNAFILSAYNHPAKLSLNVPRASCNSFSCCTFFSSMAASSFSA